MAATDWLRSGVKNMYPWEDRQEGTAATAAILFLKLTATSQPYWICAIPSS